MVKHKKREAFQEQTSTEEEKTSEEIKEIRAESELVDELEKVRREAAENYDKYVRSCAELENYKKRASKEIADVVKYGNEQLIKDILPIVDSLGRALEHASQSVDFEAFVQGLKLLDEKFMTFFEKQGVERIEAVSKNFDPNLHEALFQVESADYDDNKIVDEFEKGYLLNGRLIRPSKVSVAKHITKDNQTE